MIIRLKNPKISIPAIVVFTITAGMLISSYFLYNYSFIEAHILPKQYAIITATILLFVISLFSTKSRYILVDRITFTLCILGCYICGRIFFSNHGYINLPLLTLVAFAILYFSFKLLTAKYIAYFKGIVIWICLLQSIYGILQYVGLYDSDSGFCISGNFDNPAGFAASLIAGYPFCLAYTRKNSGSVSLFGIQTCIVIFTAVLLSGSRAGIITLLIITTLYLGATYYGCLKPRLKWLFPLSGVVIIACSVILFHLKKDSALGRILIWHTSYEMIADKPLFGHGANALEAEYMLYQAEYFTKNPDSRFALLAGNTKHTFNEFISLTVKYGITGLLLLTLLVLFIIKSAKKLSVELLCLLGIAIFACFSYPLRYPPIWIFTAFCLASASNSNNNLHFVKMPLNTSIRLIAIGIATVIGLCLVRDIKFELNWGRLVNRVRLGQLDETKEGYTALYDSWNGNSLFLYNYGAYLNRISDYQMSNMVMEKCVEHFNEYDVQLIIASNYEGMNNWDEAEKYYTIASNMIPSRFVPLYQLFKIYEQTGQIDKATNQAEVILDKPIKIPSGEVSRIKAVAEKFLSN